MRCPACDYHDSKVINSRPAEEGRAIRRRRECLSCGHRFTTYERKEDQPIIVIKSDGSSEVYDREKLMRGLLIACAKRPINPHTIEAVIASIENELHTLSSSEVSSKTLGDMVLARLASLDDVAYIRFMSVYKDFKNVDEFSEALQELRS